MQAKSLKTRVFKQAVRLNKIPTFIIIISAHFRFNLNEKLSPRNVSFRFGIIIEDNFEIEFEISDIQRQLQN